MNSSIESLLNLYTTSKENIVGDLINKNLETLKLLHYLQTSTQSNHKTLKSKKRNSSKNKRLRVRVKEEKKQETYLPPTELIFEQQNDE